MDPRRSQSVNLLPLSLGFIIAALLKAGPQPESATPVRAESGRPHKIADVRRYKATVPLDLRECALLKKFFDGMLGHIFSCGGAESGELLMYFINQPLIRRSKQGYVCDIALARVR